jgi:DNA-binding NarL/FixJ family response regulator
MDFAAAARLAGDALTDLAGSSDGPLLAEALAYSAMADYLAGHGVDWTRVERALELEDPARIALAGMPVGGVAGCLLLYAGRHAEARERLDAVRRRLIERGDERDLAPILLWLSFLETRCADFAAAARFADQSIASAGLAGNETFGRWAIAQRAWVDAHRGAIDQALRRCADALPPGGRGIIQVGLSVAATRALAGLSVGDARSAWEAARPLVERLEQEGLPEPVPAFFLPDALEALILLGDHERAAAIVDEFERSGRAHDRPWALATGGRCRALLLAASGELPAALATLEAALVQHDRIVLPFERARTLFVKGVFERRARRRAHARASLEVAAAAFQRMGAAAWAQRAREELDRTGGRPRDRMGLTPSERRAAELAAAGLSNKEIAARLVVSVHTVEVHLSRSYAKLGVSSRGKLAGRLRD